MRRLLPPPRRAERRAWLGAALRAFALATTASMWIASASAAAAFDLDALTALLGRVKAGEATFTETRRIESSTARSSRRAGSRFERPTASCARP